MKNLKNAANLCACSVNLCGTDHKHKTHTPLSPDRSGILVAQRKDIAEGRDQAYPGTGPACPLMIYIVLLI